MKKLYEFTIEERNGEQEYTYDYITYAESIEEAETTADRIASKWYGDDFEGECDIEKDGEWYIFYNSCSVCAIRVYSIGETTKEKWIEKMVNLRLV